MAPTSGFLWLKTICGSRTSGFFVLRHYAENGCVIYKHDGNQIVPAPNQVMVSGMDLRSTIQASSRKGMYLADWIATRDDWRVLCEQLEVSVLFRDNNRLFDIINCGLSPRRQTSKEAMEHKKMELIEAADAKKAEFRLDVRNAMATLRTLTVRASGSANRVLAPRRASGFALWCDCDRAPRCTSTS